MYTTTTTTTTTNFYFSTNTKLRSASTSTIYHCLPFLVFSISIIFRFFAFAIALNVICHSGIFSYKQFTCLLFILTYGAVSMGTSRFKNNLARKGIQRAPLPKGSKAHRAERKIGSRNTGERVSKIKKRA